MNDPIRDNADLLELFAPGVTQHAHTSYRAVFPDLVDHVVHSIYGFAYRRETIDRKTRHLLTLAILATMGGCEAQLDFQFKAALNLGLSPDEVREVFVQVAVFAGNARATNAARQFHNLIERAGDSSTAPASSPSEGR